MSKRPQETSAEEPDGGNPHIRFRGGPRQGDRPGLLNSNDQIVHTSDASFERDVLQSPVPVVVDFWAEWCGPCKMIAPVLDDAAAAYAGKLKIAQLTVDE